MKLGAEIGVRLLRVFYWLLWVAEAGAVWVVGFILYRLASGKSDFESDMMPFLTWLPLAVACAHYILTIPIGRKLAEDKADD